MVKSILITVCLSNDNIAPIKKHEATPTPLHIGYYETLRLLGEDWKNGPLITFLKSSYKTPKKDLAIVHTRDWHSFKDPLQREELLKYGPHCIENTWGAKLIWEGHNILHELKNKPIIINSKKIMTPSEKQFILTLKKLIGKTPKSKVKIGIIGVLTNIKVAQMAISLQGFFDIKNIAICSALTASNSIRKHFQGIEDMSNIYGIKVFNSIAMFSDWLKVKSVNKLGISKFDMPEIKCDKKEVLNPDKNKIIASLFKECKSINLKQLSGGYSGSYVFLAQTTEKQGFIQVPTILKIDKRETIGKERIGFEKIQHILGSHVPRILDYLETEQSAGIRYSFAMMNKKDKPKTFKEFYASLDFSKEECVKSLDKFFLILFEEIMTPMYSNCILDQKQLWVSNTFRPEYNPFVKSNIIKILGYIPKGDYLEIKDIGKFYNALQFYTTESINEKLEEPVSYVKQSIAHGDLNAGNIILDENFNMWLIDFFHTDYEYHVIQDIVKIENDLKFIHTPLNSLKELKQAIEFEQSLLSQRRLSDSIPELPESCKTNQNLVKLHFAIKKLRTFAYLISKDKEMRHYRIPQIRYSGHNLSFEESSKLQKMFALASTSMLCEYFKNEHIK